MKLKKEYRFTSPGGPYPVGCRYLYFESRKGRPLPCLVYFPAASGGSFLRRYTDDEVMEGGAAILTNSWLDADFAPGHYPLIVYNHGFSGYLEENTIQCEELASRGYLILSVGHVGYGSYRLPENEWSIFDFAPFREEADRGLQMFFRYSDWLKTEGKTATLEEHAQRYRSNIGDQTVMTSMSELWVEDSTEALDTLLQSDAGCHIDRDRIGALGMSYGGSAALSLALDCERIKAACDMDGFYYSGRFDIPIQRPMLLLQNGGKKGGQLLGFPFLNAASDAYLVTVNRSTHMNFTDWNELSGEDPKEGHRMLGSIDGAHMERIMNLFVVDFFDKYLKAQKAQLLDGGRLPDGVWLQKKKPAPKDR